MKNFVFKTSLCLNLLLLSAIAVLIARRGGIEYIQRNIQQRLVSSPKPREKRTQQPPRISYLTNRRLMFESLPDTPGEIVFLGDSLTHQGEWGELFDRQIIRNRGIAGDTTDSILNRLDEVVQSQPAKIFIMIGVNDLWQSKQSIEYVVNNYEQILTYLQQNTPETEVYIQSLLPVNNQKYRIDVDNQEIVAVNGQLQTLAEQFDYTYINLFDHLKNPNDNQLNPIYTFDGVHLTGAAYLKWSEIVQPYLSGSRP